MMTGVRLLTCGLLLSGSVVLGGWFGGGRAAKAQKAFNAGDFDKAITLYSKEISKKGVTYEYALSRARAYKNLGRYPEALADLQTAAGLKPEDQGIVAGEQALILFALKKHAEALAAANQALKIKPEDVALLQLKAASLMELKRHDEALASFTQLKGLLKPGSPAALAVARNQALCLLQLERFQEARQTYMAGYLTPLEKQGCQISEEDYYWAGALADVNLLDKERDQFWSKLSQRFRKLKGITLPSM